MRVVLCKLHIKVGHNMHNAMCIIQFGVVAREKRGSFQGILTLFDFEIIDFTFKKC